MSLAPEVAPPPLLPAGRDEAVALVTADASVSYAELRRLVDERTALLGVERSLVLLELGNDLDSVVGYLAALAARHPVLLVPPGGRGTADLTARYDPDVVMAGGEVRRVRSASRHDLHPDLAVLMSTSGSTGSPKLVRLSRENLRANAASIVELLGLGADDRGVTTLPLHYCYGLSVLNSHLACGASVVLTDLSVADECFWDLAATAGVTGLPGVPYTFDLLDRTGFADRSLPSLRYVTQAGGRLAPDRVQAYAALGESRGWDLYVMYGQTEATARIAYLPPELAPHRPTSVGVPVPGGSLRLADVGPDGIGELVYEGPNVMMGYATGPADLALGVTLDELRTGDLAQQGDDGLWEITGRLGRDAKLFGLRLDLDHLEAGLADVGLPARLVVAGDRLCVFTERPRRGAALRRAVAARSSLPESAVRVVRLERLPRTGSGKVDYAALAEHAAASVDVGPAAAPGAGGVRDLYAVVLGRPDAGLDDSFVELGGDSLSYVEVAHRLGQRFGDLPTDWPRRTPQQIADHAEARGRPRFTAAVETSVLLRAAAIVLILVSHADIAHLEGGAHVLLAVAGYNLARFQLGLASRLDRVRGLLRAAAGVGVPAALWVGGVALVTGAYHWPTALLLNQVLGTDRWSADWQLWFLEALVWTYVALAALVAVPLLHRWSVRRPFGVAVGAVAAAGVLRYALVGVEAGPTQRYEMPVVLWCVALGWAAAVATRRWHRLLVVVAAVVLTAGFFDDQQRDLIVAAGVVLLLLVPRVRIARPLLGAVHAMAAASLWIYLTQWEVYPRLEDAGHPWAAVAASIAVGVVAHRIWSRLGLWWGLWRGCDSLSVRRRGWSLAARPSTMEASTGAPLPRSGR